jgi:hypothetical protein
MSQHKLPFKALNRHLRLTLVLLVNTFAPSLGNLIFVGFNLANLFAAAMSFFIWTKHNQEMLWVWYVLLGLRAFGDIYLLSNKKKPHGAAHLQQASPHGQHNVSHANEKSPMLEHLSSHSHSPYKAPDLNSHSSYSPPDLQSSPNAHSSSTQPPRQNNSEASLHQPKDHAQHKVGWDPKFHLHDHDNQQAPTLKPLELNAKQHEQGSHRSLAHSSDPLFHAESSAQSTEKQAPLSPEGNSSESAVLRSNVLESDVLESDVLESNVLESNVLDPDKHRHLSHAEFPMAHKDEPAAQAAANTSDDESVIYDLYGEEEAENESSISPLADGFYHDIHTGEDSSSAAPEAHSSGTEPAHASSAHQLKSANSGLGDELSLPIEHHKKQVQLCSNCQRPREHNRPKCPTCGTHFDMDG